MARAHGKTFEGAASKRKEKAGANRRAEHPFLEFFLTALFFVLLIIIAAAFLFLPL